MRGDIHNTIFAAPALNVGAISSSTTTVGVAVDSIGYNATSVVIHAGTVTDGTYTPSVFESDDATFATESEVQKYIGTPAYASDFDVAYTPIADATFVAADDNKVARLGFLLTKRYFRLKLVSAGVTTGGTFSAIALLGEAIRTPVDKSK